METARVHRFHDFAAIHVGDGSTCYLSPMMARELGKALIDCANDIDAVDFLRSHFATQDITIFDRLDRETNERSQK
jgi:hypothetical protein